MRSVLVCVAMLGLACADRHAQHDAGSADAGSAGAIGSAGASGSGSPGGSGGSIAAHGSGGGGGSGSSDEECPTSPASIARPVSIRVDYGDAGLPDREEGGSYQGKVHVTEAREGSTELETDDGLRVVVDGGVALPDGATLWASLEEYSERVSFPFRLRTRANQLRLSEGGPIIAEEREHTLGDTTFLGVTTNVAAICRRPARAGFCAQSELYSATIHGDTDLTLTPSSGGRLKIGGIEYDVRLDSAAADVPVDGQPICPDLGGAWSRTLSINGHVVDYASLLQAP